MTKQVRIGLSHYELVELTEILSNKLEYCPELIPLYQKLCKQQMKLVKDVTLQKGEVFQ